MDARIEKITDLLTADAAHVLASDELARTVNLSVRRLRHLFKEEMGLPIRCYISRIRMRRARKLLSHSYLRVKEIMNSVGINDKTHFCRAFKKEFGITPSGYRRRVARGREKLLRPVRK